MKQVKLLRSWRWLVTMLFLVGAPLALAGIWRTASNDTNDAGQSKRAYKAQIRKGLGSEVKFSNSGDPTRDAHETVDSIAKFIAGRSNLVMSTATKARLVAMEAGALSGKGRRISVEDLTDALTGTLSERVSTLSDQEISQVSEVLRGHHGNIALRANGEFSVTTEEFNAQAKAFRDLSGSGNTAAREALRTITKREVDNRVTLLEEALPEQFGSSRRDGVTPAQAILITYSVISDDLLDGTQEELQRTVRRLPEVVNRELVPGTKAEKAFGTKGRLFSTPIDLVFNKKTMSSFLTRIEKGRNSQ